MLYFIGGLALLALGITMLAKPRLFFELEKLWIQNGRGSEPSDLSEYKIRRCDVYAGRYLRHARSIPVPIVTHELQL